jgi:transketolase
MNPNRIRRKIVDIVTRSGEGHIASSFSIVEILLGIYKASSTTGTFSPRNIVLSKGHASYAYYAFLNEINWMTDLEFNAVGSIGSKYYGHVPFVNEDERFQFGSGSLGHGLPFSVGVGYAREIRNIGQPVYCIVGDGEANEGTFWESLLYIQKFNLKNLNIIIDSNESSERAIPIKKTLGELAPAFRSLSFHTCDGHNPNIIANTLLTSSGSKLVICETKKGYPISFMMNNPAWHHKTPSPQESKILGDLLS